MVIPLFDKFVDSLVDHTDDGCVVDTNNEISFNFVEIKDNFVDEFTNNVVTVNDDVALVNCDKPITIDAVHEVDKDVNHSQVDKTTEEL